MFKVVTEVEMLAINSVENEMESQLKVSKKNTEW